MPTPAFFQRLAATRIGRVAVSRRFELAAVAVSAASAAGVLLVEGRYPHPSGGDPGQWLMMANLYLGRGQADISPYQYPPAYFFVLSALMLLLGDPVAALFATVGLMFFLLPLAAFYAYRLITGDDLGALFFAALVPLSYTFLDMLSWGGYPNLISLPPFLLSMAYLVRTSRPAALRRDFVLLGLFGGLTFLSHPLSSLFLAAGASSYFVLHQLWRRDGSWLRSLIAYTMPLFAALYLPYLAVFSTLGENTPLYVTSQTVFSLEKVFYPLVPWYARPWFPFAPAPTVALAALIIAGMLAPLFGLARRKELGRFGSFLAGAPDASEAVRWYFLVLSTGALPLAIPIVMWALGYYSDFGRFTYYCYFPLAALAARLMSQASKSDPVALLRKAARRPVPAPPAAQHPLRRASTPSAFAVVLALLAAFNLTYLETAAAYYSGFIDPADGELVAWVRAQTALDDRFLLSPETENTHAIKWLGGLSGRRVYGFVPSVWLFYDQERTRNFEVFQMFNNRFAISGRALEVSSQGTAPYSDFQLRVSVLNRFEAFPTVDFRDDDTQAVFADGTSVMLSNLAVRSVETLIDSPSSLAIYTRAFDPGTGLEVTRFARLVGDTVEVTFNASSPGERPAFIRFNTSPAARLCGVGAVPGGLEWSVWDAGSCYKLLMQPDPAPVAADLSTGQPQLTLALPPGAGAVIRFEAPDADSGFGSPTRYYDSSDLFERQGIDYVILLRSNPVFLTFIRGEYGHTVAYENSKYIVLKVV